MSERTIVIIEDEPAHARILEKSVRRLGLTQPIMTIPTANLALDYLQSLDDSVVSNAADKHVLIVDLNLPGINGFDFLEALSHNPAFSAIPRIIVSTSDEPRDIIRSHDYPHVAYMVKPLNYAELVRIIRSLDDPDGQHTAP